jgi:hypothetical protein
MRTTSARNWNCSSLAMGMLRRSGTGVPHSGHAGRPREPRRSYPQTAQGFGASSAGVDGCSVGGAAGGKGLREACGGLGGGEGAAARGSSGRRSKPTSGSSSEAGAGLSTAAGRAGDSPESLPSIGPRLAGRTGRCEARESLSGSRACPSDAPRAPPSPKLLGFVGWSEAMWRADWGWTREVDSVVHGACRPVHGTACHVPCTVCCRSLCGPWPPHKRHSRIEICTDDR